MKKLLFSVLVALLFVACSKTLENTSIFAEIEPDEFKALLEKVEDAEFKEFCEEAPEGVALMKEILSEDDIKEFEGITYKDWYEYVEYNNGKRTDEELKKFNEDCYNFEKRLVEAFTLEYTSIFAEIEPDEFKALLEKVEDAEFKEFCEEAHEGVAFIKGILSEDDIKEFEGITYKDWYEYVEYDNGKRTDEELKKFNEDCYNLGKRLEEFFSNF